MRFAGVPQSAEGLTTMGRCNLVRMLACRLIAGLFGLLLLCGTLLLDDEQKGLQDRLVSIWVGISALADSVGSKTTAFLQVSSGLVQIAIGRLFGQSMFSLQAVGVAVWLSVGALGAAAAISPESAIAVFDFLGRDYPGDSVLSVLRFDQVAVGFFAMILGAIPVFVSMRVWLPLWLVGLLGAHVLFFSAINSAGVVLRTDNVSMWQVFSLGVIAAAVGNLIFAAAAVRLLSLRSRWKHPLAIFLIPVGLFLFAAVVSIGPAFFFFDDIMRGGPHPIVYCAVFLASRGCLLTYMSSILFFLIGALLLIHRLLWLILPRGIHFVYDAKLLSERKLLGGLGFALLAFSLFGNAVPLLRKLKEVVGL
jgi:hypothetical protein